MPPPPSRIRLLGPITIEPTRLGAPKLACVLAALALRPGTPVAQTELIDRVWDGDPPDAVLNVLYSYVARLRAALKSVPGAAIRRAGSHGYVLDIDPSAIDLHAVRALRDEARRTAGRPAEATEGVRRPHETRKRAGRPEQALERVGRPAEALELLRQACELVGDDALVGLSGRWADETRAALAAERLELLTERYAAELDAGHHAAVLGDLTALSDAEPLAEPVAELLMLAYYRSGRPADALTRFETTRTRLRDELGADPSQRLRDLHLQILNHDPTLDLPTAAPIQLPSDIPGFTGRTTELKALEQLAESASLAAVVGPGGAGKTALAVHWGHSMIDRFPGGLLYVNLRGFDEGDMVSPREALGRLLVAMNLPGDAVPDDVDAAAELFRATTADRGVLVILDNARSAEQVRPLLPGAGAFTIVTSRDRLTGLIALNDARPVPVGMLDQAEAMELLTRILGADRVQSESEAAARLAELCGHLALALRIAAAHLAGEPIIRIADYVDELERRDRLDVLAVDGDPSATVTANLELSYRVLDQDTRDLFARLGMLPGEDFAEELITSASGSAETATLRALRRLVTAHLVEQPRVRRYRMHDLVRLYAARTGERELGEQDRSTLIDSFIEWHHDRAYQPINDEETNIFLACETLADHPKLWRLVLPLRNTINEWRFISRVQRLIEVGTRRAEEAADGLGLFRMTSMAATARRATGDSDAAIELGTRALTLAEPLTAREQTVASGNLGIYLFDYGDLAGSAAAFIRGVDLAIASGNTRSQLIFTSSMAQVLVRLGRFDEAEAYVRSAEALGEDALSPEQRIRLELSNAEIHFNRGDFERAMVAADRAIAIARQGSYGHLDMWCMQVQAQILLHSGRAEEARALYDEEVRQVRSRKMVSYEPEALSYLASVLVELREYAGAGELIAEARRKQPQVGRGLQVFVNLVLAGVHNGLGEFETALAHATEAVTGYAAMPWPARHELALVALADAYAGLGDPGTAREHRASADRIACPVNQLRRHR
ncbi:AfsR/SARP family transcriptional regulator [Kribbella yunnanensis]|uniref:AfsR/SARP family transcriptional regulator n=1 Tax=Kribbella yunnanensis TaxID=190194 RepID=UPI0031E3B752